MNQDAAFYSFSQKGSSSRRIWYAYAGQEGSTGESEEKDPAASELSSVTQDATRNNFGPMDYQSELRSNMHKFMYESSRNLLPPAFSTFVPFLHFRPLIFF